MPKQPLSVTLEKANLLWLRGRAARRKNRSLIDALDEVLTQARQGGRGSDAPRSVVGTVDIAPDDPALDKADELIRSLMADSLTRPILARERATREYAASPRKPRRG